MTLVLVFSLIHCGLTKNRVREKWEGHSYDLFREGLQRLFTFSNCFKENSLSRLWVWSLWVCMSKILHLFPQLPECCKLLPMKQCNWIINKMKVSTNLYYVAFPLNYEDLGDQTPDSPLTPLTTQCQLTDPALGESAFFHSIPEEWPKSGQSLSDLWGLRGHQGSHRGNNKASDQRV